MEEAKALEETLREVARQQLPELFESIKKNNIDYSKLKETIEGNTYLLTETDKDGNTLLHIACEHLDPILVKYLLQNGSKLETPNKEGEKPFDEVYNVFINLINKSDKKTYGESESIEPFEKSFEIFKALQEYRADIKEAYKKKIIKEKEKIEKEKEFADKLKKIMTCCKNGKLNDLIAFFPEKDTEEFQAIIEKSKLYLAASGNKNIINALVNFGVKFDDLPYFTRLKIKRSVEELSKDEEKALEAIKKEDLKKFKEAVTSSNLGIDTQKSTNITKAIVDEFSRSGNYAKCYEIFDFFKTHCKNNGIILEEGEFIKCVSRVANTLIRLCENNDPSGVEKIITDNQQFFSNQQSGLQNLTFKDKNLFNSAIEKSQFALALSLAVKDEKKINTVKKALEKKLKELIKKKNLTKEEEKKLSEARNLLNKIEAKKKNNLPKIQSATLNDREQQNLTKNIIQEKNEKENIANISKKLMIDEKLAKSFYDFLNSIIELNKKHLINTLARNFLDRANAIKLFKTLENINIEIIADRIKELTILSEKYETKEKRNREVSKLIDKMNKNLSKESEKEIDNKYQEAFKSLRIATNNKKSVLHSGR